MYMLSVDWSGLTGAFCMGNGEGTYVLTHRLMTVGYLVVL